MTVYFVISLPKTPYLRRIYMVLANPTCQLFAQTDTQTQTHLHPHTHTRTHTTTQPCRPLTHPPTHTHKPS